MLTEQEIQAEFRWWLFKYIIASLLAGLVFGVAMAELVLWIF